ncbi:hypothetical protein MKW98_031940 [Papaver atlanticum]|uniref:CUE domain-containing protein n=1 Tax=Papaver atlanticum TaxID=357466 RepID=A0AAD4XD75_9MAGN|nr:hypothetical protein MKW98_031940 [Papaver atlanticum]
MSSRSSRGGFNNKSQQKYVPKNQNSNSSSSSNPPPLTTSLRGIHTSTSSSSSSASASTSNSRVKIGDNGKDWVAKQSGSAGGGNYVLYLPQDEAVASGLGAEYGASDPVESQRAVDLLNRELSRLLKSNPRDFWKEVASDTSLHEFLDSFLKFRNRWYDFQHHGAKGIVAGVIVGEFELSRRVFMVLYRISSNKDPGAVSSNSLSPKEHGALLQEKKLLDVPKLIDICAIYGHENEELTNLLVMNAMKAQPSLHENLTSVVSRFLHITYTTHQRCNSSLEARFSSGQSGGAEDIDCRLISDLSEVMDLLNDAVVSLDAFVNAYKPAALYFSCLAEVSDGNGELLSTLARLHDSLLPSLQKGLRHIFSSGKKETQDSISDKLPNLAIGLKMLSVRLVSLGWKLLESCYLSDELFEGSLPLPHLTNMFPAKVDDPGIRGEILVQTFKELNEEVSHHFWENKNSGTFLQNVEKYYKILSRLNDLRSLGWIFIDEEQFQYISLIAAPNFSPQTMNNRESLPITTGKNMQMDDDAAVTESKISQVKDLFPDYGKGFLAACLEVYNHNPEEVIQRILEGTLHEDLQFLDISLESMPAPKSSLSKSRNDKGKGILIEHTTETSTNVVSPVQEQLPEVSLSSFGRFTRKSRVDSINSKPLDLRVNEDTAKAAILASQYEYEDEYDDSFDDLGLSFVEPGFEETETLRDRSSSSVPKKSLGGDIERPGQSKSAGGAKWNTKKTPQFYVKDGKNYSYKVSGSVAVANSQEAALLNQTQKETIHGLGRGGNLPVGAVKVMNELNYHQQKQPEEGRNPPNTWGRGKRGGGANPHQQDSGGGDTRESGNPENVSRGRGGRGGGATHYQHQQGSRVNNSEASGNSENFSRGRGGRGGGGNHYQHQQGSRVSGPEESGNSENFVKGRGGGANHNQHQQGSRASGPEEGGNSENSSGSRGGGRGRVGGSNHNQQQQDSEFEDSGENGNAEIPNSGRARGGRRGGGRHNHYRKDQAMKKHFSGLGL